MEAFVELIMETDRKARVLIDEAQEEGKQILASAEKRADEELKRREAVLEKGKQQVDEQLALDTQKECEEMDRNYLSAKRALDKAFEDKRVRWLAELQQSILEGRA